MIIQVIFTLTLSEHVNAFITHAHAIMPGISMDNYFCTPETAEIIRHRIDKNLSIKEIKYHQRIKFNQVYVTFYPAGHVLGSAQILIEYKGNRTIITGDYKRQPDSTCKAFEPVQCNTFISEAFLQILNLNGDHLTKKSKISINGSLRIKRKD